MTEIGLNEAKAMLPKLVERAEAGEDITLTRNGTPVARLVPVANSFATIRGAFRGRVHFADDFDKLPDDIAEAFGAR